MPEQPMDPHIDQVKLTAYAMGELNEDDAAEVELWISGDPAARRHVEMVREESQVLRRAFHARSATLDEAHHERLTDVIGDRERQPSIAASLGIAAGLAAAACLALLVVLPMFTGEDDASTTDTLALNEQPNGMTGSDTLGLPDAPAFDLNAAQSNMRSGGDNAQPRTAFGKAAESQDAVMMAGRATRRTNQGASLFGDGRAQPASDRMGVDTGGPIRLDTIPTEPYTVVEGQTLAMIAREKLGDAAHADLIARLNRDAIPDPDHIEVGQEILLPDIERWVEPSDLERYDQIVDNPFLAAADNPLSTFSIDVDTASYANLRRMLLRDGTLPPKGAVRIEEMVNYFPYDYSGAMDPEQAVGPDGEPDDTIDPPFGASVAVASAPWNPAHRLVRIGLKGDEPNADKPRPHANLVFLIDVSGSMRSDDKLPLLQASLKRLVDELADTDRVAIAVYAGAAGLVLDSTPATERQKIIDAIDNLRAGGSTAGGEGIKLAYQVALENYIDDGVNRVILASDGYFNVGPSSDSELIELIESRANPTPGSKHEDKGVYLSVLGFGTGNLNDQMMEKVSNAGNGNYAYIDSLREAQKVLIEQMGGTLVTIAKDVKIQVEFNPAEVASYRLIGYENRILAKEDFADDTVDAGDIGAGHTVTALYEVVPVDHAAKRAALEARVRENERAIENIEALKQMARMTPEKLAALNQQVTDHRDAIRALRRQLAAMPAPRPVDDLRYQGERELTEAAAAGELMTLKLRYKAPDAPAEQGTSSLLVFPVRDEGATLDEADEDFKFAAAVAGFGMLLRDSPHKGDASYESVKALAEAGVGDDPRGYRAELITMIDKAAELTAQK